MTDIDALAIHVLTKAFDTFIGECMDADGNAKAPTRKALMRARAALPAGYRHTLVKAKDLPDE
jgi:hypothetical protein